MTGLGGFLVLFSCTVSVAYCYTCEELANPAVFDAHFYLNTNPDLEDAGLHTPELAADHWCNNGIGEGRQATSSFHTRQYLDNYPDLLMFLHLLGEGSWQLIKDVGKEDPWDKNEVDKALNILGVESGMY